MLLLYSVSTIHVLDSVDDEELVSLEDSSHPGDLPPLLGALLTQELAPGLFSHTRRARSCSSKSSDQKSAETRKKRVDASSTPKQPRL